MVKNKQIKFIVDNTEAGQRLDNLIIQHAKCSRVEVISRAYVQKLINREEVEINGNKAKKPGIKLNIGVKVIVKVPKIVDLSLTPKNIPLELAYEDDDLAVINKNAGITVHPAEHEISSEKDNLVQALLYCLKGKLSRIGGVKRRGIVHRLDKNTSGLLIVAKNDFTHQKLSDDFKNQRIEKRYLALVVGRLKSKQGKIVMSIGRSRSDRKKRAIDGIAARNAITEYQVLKTFFGADKNYYSLLEINLKTGRTHQIRVHFKAIGHFLVGDAVYGSNKVNKWFLDKFDLKRQFLHAFQIIFLQPRTHKKIELKSVLPNDLKNVLKGLKEVE